MQLLDAASNVKPHLAYYSKAEQTVAESKWLGDLQLETPGSTDKKVHPPTTIPFAMVLEHPLIRTFDVVKSCKTNQQKWDITAQEDELQSKAALKETQPRDWEQLMEANARKPTDLSGVLPFDQLDMDTLVNPVIEQQMTSHIGAGGDVMLAGSQTSGG